MKSRKDVSDMTPDQLVSWFMIAGYAYYRLGERVMEDTDFDYLVRRLKECWEQTSHPHKKLITLGHLNAATGYDIKYPTIVKYSARHYLRKINETR